MLRPEPSTARATARRTTRGTRLARRSGLYWLVALALAIGGAWLLLGTVSQAEATRRSWGTQRVVLVATRALPPGTVIQPADVVAQRWPAGLVPPGASGESPAGQTVTATVLAGEVLNDARLGPGGVGGPAGLLGAGRRAVAIPVEAGRLPLRIGDRVDLVGFGPDGEPTVLTRDGEVLGVDDTTLMVALPAGDAPAVAAGVAGGTVIPVLRPPVGH